MLPGELLQPPGSARLVCPPGSARLGLYAGSASLGLPAWVCPPGSVLRVCSPGSALLGLSTGSTRLGLPTWSLGRLPAGSAHLGLPAGSARARLCFLNRRYQHSHQADPAPPLSASFPRWKNSDGKGRRPSTRLPADPPGRVMDKP